MKLRISLSVVVLLLVSAIVHADTPRPKTCSATASALQRACALEAADDLSVATAVCINGADTVRCLRNARARHVATLEECSAVREQRDDVCDALGEAPYAPAFGTAFAANFVHPNRIGHGVAPNPYLPLVVGNKWVYSKPILDADGDSAIEIVTVTVSTETKLIDGIQCRVVHDTVRVDNELVEDTDDWFAQDLAGNVWYCGEMVRDYATFDGDRPEVPELISRDGSFKAGRNGD